MHPKGKNKNHQRTLAKVRYSVTAAKGGSFKSESSGVVRVTDRAREIKPAMSTGFRVRNGSKCRE